MKLNEDRGPNSFALADELMEQPGDQGFLATLNQLLREGLVLGIDAGGPLNDRIAIGVNPEKADAIAADLRAHDVFVSYSTQDKTIAEEIARDLRDHGFCVFLAHQTITVGPKWEDQVADAARSCRVAVLLLSEHSRNSDWVRFEIGAFWALGKLVAPGLIGLAPTDVPALVGKYQGRSVSSSADRKKFCEEVRRLLIAQQGGQPDRR